MLGNISGTKHLYSRKWWCDLAHEILDLDHRIDLATARAEPEKQPEAAE